jgi:hypothetical protein
MTVAQFPLNPTDDAQLQAWSVEKDSALRFVALLRVFLASHAIETRYLKSREFEPWDPEKQVTAHFIRDVAQLLADHYQFTFDTQLLLRENPVDVTLETVLAEAAR